MKPRDLTENNFDINTAVLDLGDTEVRIYADGTGIWFRNVSSTSTTDVAIPIKTWKRIVGLFEDFSKEDLSEDDNSVFFLPSRRYEFSILGGIIKFDKKNRQRKLIKRPLSIMIGQWPRSVESWSLQLRFSTFKKIVKWYNTDV